ncbi:MAG: DUF952 domain-containing protein [Phyllobacteriaceae bacterium]|jgi:uncharacterized protein (DUF952 family)|nr:DUF952 domain-containing protein [Phyllobacteriaceae bacterium]
MAIIYKILPEALWQAAQRSGSFAGAAIDLTDGYIHFSTAGQAVETARRHFHGQRELLLVAFEAEALGDALRWEPSRGGDLFPHLYAVLDPALALWVKPLPWAGGQHDFPEGWTA